MRRKEIKGRIIRVREEGETEGLIEKIGEEQIWRKEGGREGLGVLGRN